jgi:hypothetical protein
MKKVGWPKSQPTFIYAADAAFAVTLLASYSSSEGTFTSARFA